MTQLPAEDELRALIERNSRLDVLRFITCGSVDDGKSTLIGRLLYEAKAVFDDQLAALSADSARFGTTGGMDFALLVDGLSAEREQGITIDVAYRFFATPRRKFIVADTPGHEQYTRNMATGASTADLAVLLVDARQGLLTQTRRHSFIVRLLGVRHVVLAVNKMDLVGYAEDVFERIAADYRAFAARIGIATVTAIPLSALTGANVTRPAAEMAWYGGPALLPFLESVEVGGEAADAPFRLPVQWVNRPDAGFRGYAGTIVSGRVRPGDAVAVLPSGRTTTVQAVLRDGGQAEARAGEAVTLTLADAVDVGRGDVIAAAAEPPEIADQFGAHVVWMAEDGLLTGRRYLFQFGPLVVGGHVSTLKHAINVNTQEHVAARRLGLNDIGVCTLALDRPIPFDPYAANRAMGGFIVIDRASGATVGCGMIDFALHRSANLRWQHLEVDKAARAALKGQVPGVVWFTGLSGAGKSTLANALEKRLLALGHHTYLLDGDNLRHGLSRDLGFRTEDRVENIRRAAEVAKLMVDAGLIVLAAFISPFRAERRMAREIMGAGEFIEVWVDTPLAVCEARDPKGLYRKARAGALANFTGVDQPYEPPESPDLILDTSAAPVDDLTARLLDLLRARGFI